MMAGASVAVVNMIVKMTMEHCLSPQLLRHITMYHDMSHIKIYLYMDSARGAKEKLRTPAQADPTRRAGRQARQALDFRRPLG
jgi:hypothetical protein